MLFSRGYSFHPCGLRNSFTIKFAICTSKARLGGEICLSQDVTMLKDYLMLGEGRLPCDGLDNHPGGVEIFLVGTRNELRPDKPLGSYADLTLTYSCAPVFENSSFYLILK